MEPSNETPAVTSANAAADAPVDPNFERARALLVALGPADALRVLGGITGALAVKAKTEAADPALAATWGSWAGRIARLAESDETSDRDDETEDEEEDADASEAQAEDSEEEEEADEEETEEHLPRPRKERPKMRRLVAGMFDINARVESCRLREVNAIGGLGETVGYANAQGIEETEWPIAAMTPDLLRRLTGRGGKFRFEWFGRDDAGARVALGRSRAFKAHGDEAVESRKREIDLVIPPPAPAPVVVSSGGITFEQMLAFQRHNDDRAEREKTRQIELDRMREEVASRERIEKMKLEAEIVKAKAAAPGGPHFDPDAPLTAATVAAIINQRLGSHFGEGNEEEEDDEDDADDMELPKWLEALGLNKQVLTTFGPLIAQHLPMLLGGLAAGPGSAPAMPYAPPGAAAAGEGGTE